MSTLTVQAILWVAAIAVLLMYLKRRRKRKITTLP
jgi:hypothetical protein